MSFESPALPHAADQKRAEPQRLMPAPLEEKLVRTMGRSGGILLIVISLALAFSLVSWSAGDPSLTFSTGGRVHNALGAAGAIVSDLLLQMLGFAAIPAVIAPLMWGIDLSVDERVGNFRTKAALYPISLLALAGGLSGVPAPEVWPLHHGLGGILGDVLFNSVSGFFGALGAGRAHVVTSIILGGGGLSALAGSLGVEPKHLKAALLPAVFVDAASGSSGFDAGAWLSGRWQAWRQRARREAELESEATSGASDPRLDPVPPPTMWQSHPPHAATMPPMAPHSSMAPYGQAYGQPAPWQPVAVMVPAGADLYEDGGDLDPLPSFITGKTRETISIDPKLRNPQPMRVEPHPVPQSFGEPQVDQLPRAEPPAPDAEAQSTEPAAAGAGAMLRGLARRMAAQSGGYKRPSLNLLKRAQATRPQPELAQTVLRGNARLLEDTLNDFGVKGEIRDIRPGPVVTVYELEPARGTKSARVIGLSDDIARSMSAASVRVAVVPGRNAIGIELPNVRRDSVLLREILESDAYRSSTAALPVALGKSISGDPLVVDLARMPHLLVAGTTGSGKSVGVNAFILSLVFRHAPEDCRMILIDPKMLELSVYDGIPHLLTPVVTDPVKAVAALEWAVGEMEERYKRMSKLAVRNIDVFNNRVRNAKKRGEMLARTVQTGFDKRTGQAIFEKEEMALAPMPYIVIVVDEFADLMLVAGKEIEAAVQRLAQMARAAGIHLVMATQRPSVDVITGTIKANFPSRISFKVASKIDSRTILNDQGAEQLLGQGDMLYSTGSGQATRVHGAFVADEEVEAVAQALRQQGEPRYVDGITDAAPAPGSDDEQDDGRSEGDLYDRAVAVVMRDRKASTSYLQRRLGIGYNRAADLIERMEREGLVSAANAVGKREILSPSVSAAE